MRVSIVTTVLNGVKTIRTALDSVRRQSLPSGIELEHIVVDGMSTVYQNVDTHSHAATWRNRFLENYKAFYGDDLVVPRWHEVKNNYVLPKKAKGARKSKDSK